MSLTSIIIAISGFILTTCGFLFKHTLKSIFIDPSSDPKLLFGNGRTKLVIKTCDVLTLENSIESKVKSKMETEWKTYAPKNLNPYYNPMLTNADHAFKAKSLNWCKQLYLESKEDYIRNTLKSEIIGQRWCPIVIYIVNNGSIATKSMRVILKGCDGLFRNSKVREVTGEYFNPPTGAEGFSRDIIATPDFYLGRNDYKYLRLTEEGPITQDLKYDISESIRQGKDNKIKLDTLYVDRSRTNSIELEWTIYEDSLGKNGNHGKLKIECGS